jgi:hypothetical protein
MWHDDLNRLLVLPRAQQYAALQALRVQHAAPLAEEWNVTFGPASLYEALTHLPAFQGIYQANRAVLSRWLEPRPYWHIVEVGGGNGALWRDFFRGNEQGQFTLIDPAPEPHTVISALLPSGMTFHSVMAPIQEADMPEADVVVCSLMLHHIAGIDAQERLRHGLTGPGKREVLARLVAVLRAWKGLGILNEADVYHDLSLSPGDPLLVEPLMDSYVRRGATMVAAELAQPDLEESLRQRWELILHHWFIDQIDKAQVSATERDVYELDAPRWLQLLSQVGASVQSHRYTDDWHAVVQYVFSPIGE